MVSNIAAERVESESPKAKEEAKTEETITAGQGFNFENGMNPVVASAADRHAEIASIISPVETVESALETKKMKNVKKNKQKNEVQVSDTKKPFVFYLNRAKTYIHEFNEVELCGLGMAIPTVVTIAEILKRNGSAIQKGLATSTVLGTHED
ncbi:uncharacterized protein LOC120115032 [Hibiscus syriacus]|uniref:uncharacterized protein LOC120115032 n=1 Tax=Hibiscus syriacus TaxID=106335 RepID=UPI0019207B11|nr:uncharacterized protein LOC120115032 [Hibiscus syriacus]